MPAGQASGSNMLSEKPVKRNGKRPGRKPSKIDVKAKLERSRQSARECRARKKLRYQYLEELVLNREQAIYSLRDELEVFKQWCIQVDNGIVTDKLLDTVSTSPAPTTSITGQGQGYRSRGSSRKRTAPSSHTSTAPSSRTSTATSSHFGTSGSQDLQSRQPVDDSSQLHGAGVVIQDLDQNYPASRTVYPGQAGHVSESEQVTCTRSQFTSPEAGALHSDRICMPVTYHSSGRQTFTTPVTTSSSMDYLGRSHEDIPVTCPPSALPMTTDCSVLPSYGMYYPQPSTSQGASSAGSGKASWLSFLTADLETELAGPATSMGARTEAAATAVAQCAGAVVTGLPTVIADWSSDSSSDG